MYNLLFGYCLEIACDIFSTMNTHNMAFNGWTRRQHHMGVIFFLEVLLLDNISHCPVVVKEGIDVDDCYGTVYRCGMTFVWHILSFSF